MESIESSLQVLHLSIICQGKLAMCTFTGVVHLHLGRAVQYLAGCLEVEVQQSCNAEIEAYDDVRNMDRGNLAYPKSGGRPNLCTNFARPPQWLKRLYQIFPALKQFSQEFHMVKTENRPARVQDFFNEEKSRFLDFFWHLNSPVWASHTTF